MKILAIETSCDETAVCVLDAQGALSRMEFSVLGNALLSQVEAHRQFGGVYPSLAKREHAKNLVPVTEMALSEAGLSIPPGKKIPDAVREELQKLFVREPELFEAFIPFIESIAVPDIDAIAVTQGPGLEPALWVGINFAKALSVVWEKPLYPINHLEGHIFASLLENGIIAEPSFPALALVISGGHTELLLMRDWLSYERMGQTLDDAVGEAFDKAARMLGLPYPGGPEISRLAELARTEGVLPPVVLPRPMLHSPNFNFSFSGLKTALLYAVKNIPEMTPQVQMGFAREFEDAAVDVLVHKSLAALTESGAQALIVGGGVSANATLSAALAHAVERLSSSIRLFIPSRTLSTDNAVMIGLAAYVRSCGGGEPSSLASITADGNLSLSSKN